jgi:NADH-quinone oxidoreductase subunit L
MGGLRLLMPVTCISFIIGWLAICGVPPFAGFWSKDEILISVWDHPDEPLYKVLWAVAALTAILTAFYMTRQVIIVFFGKARWEDRHEEHGAHGDFKPHESPAVMLIPLVVLAGASMVGGALNLPFSDETKRLLRWLEPVVEFGEIEPHVDAATQWFFAITTSVVVILAMYGAYLVYQRRKLTPFEPAILYDGWHYDRAVSWFMGNPGRKGFETTAWVDANVVDGAVNGVAVSVRGSGGLLRKAQSGFVRQYALLLGAGAVLLLGWFFLRALGAFG